MQMKDKYDLFIRRISFTLPTFAQNTFNVTSVMRRKIIEAENRRSFLNALRIIKINSQLGLKSN